MGHALGRGGRQGPHLDLDALLASGASGAEGPRSLHRRARRTAACGQCPHVGQPARRSAQEVTIGAAVEAVFEPHDDAATPYTLVQWRIADRASRPVVAGMAGPSLASPRCRPSELGGRAGQQFPFSALFLPVHQDVEIGGALLAVGDRFALTHPMKPYDRDIADHADRGVLVFQRQEFRFSCSGVLDERRLVLDVGVRVAVAQFCRAEPVECLGSAATWAERNASRRFATASSSAVSACAALAPSRPTATNPRTGNRPVK